MEKLYYDRNTLAAEENANIISGAEEVGGVQETEEERRIKDEEMNLRKEWEEQVSDFTASDLLTVKVKAKKVYVYIYYFYYQNFYEQIAVPTIIKIAYFVNDENEKIDFHIKNPKGEIIYSSKNKGQLYYELNIQLLGLYTFKLDNSRVYLLNIFRQLLIKE